MTTSNKPLAQNQESHSKAMESYTSSLQLVQTPPWVRSVSVVIIFLVVFIVVLLFVVPWLQNIEGAGRVTSFVPGARPQTIEAQITARLLKLYINEGVTVKKGDTIAVLQDLNVNFMDTEMLAKIQNVRNNTIKSEELAIQTAKQRTVQAIQALLASEAALDNAMVESSTARTRYKRAEDLTKEGLAATRDVETALLVLQKAQADSVRSETAVESAKRNVDAARFEENRIVQQADLRINEADLRLGNAFQRQGASIVLAPSDGTVVNVAHVGTGQMFKEGDMIARIVPTSSDQAVEILINSRDAAIVDVGRPVRLQFSGFPAFVFNPGWDKFTLNTFGGKVAVVDAVDDGSGYYRVLVVPDSTQPQGTWPPQRYLRQGMPATGWILLNEVSLGFELWRQLNGFPPVMPSKKDASSTKSKSDGKEK